MAAEAPTPHPETTHQQVPLDPAPAPERAVGHASWAWPPFRRLGMSQIAAAAGDGMVAVALATTLFFAVPAGEARTKVALYLGITMTPFSVLAPLVGPWLDRWRGSYRVALVVAAAGRAALAVWLASRTEGVALYPLAFGLLVLSRVHSVSKAAMVPEVMPPGRTLMWANAWLAVVTTAASAVGAGVAAGLNHVFSTDVTLTVAAMVFGAGALVAVQLPKIESGRRPAEELGAEVHTLLSTRLVAGGLAMASGRAAVGYLTFLLAFLLRDEGQVGRSFAIAAACAGIGAFAGAGLAPVLRRLLKEPLLLIVSLSAMSVAALWAGGSFSLMRAGIVAGTVAVGTASGRLAFDSLLQQDAPEHIRGRTFARYETIFQLCWVGGAGLATLVHPGPEIGFRILGAICAVGAVLSINGLRRRRLTPAREVLDDPA